MGSVDILGIVHQDLWRRSYSKGSLHLSRSIQWGWGMHWWKKRNEGMSNTAMSLSNKFNNYLSRLWSTRLRLCFRFKWPIIWLLHRIPVQTPMHRLPKSTHWDMHQMAYITLYLPYKLPLAPNLFTCDDGNMSYRPFNFQSYPFSPLVGF